MAATYYQNSLENVDLSASIIVYPCSSVWYGVPATSQSLSCTRGAAVSFSPGRRDAEDFKDRVDTCMIACLTGKAVPLTDDSTCRTTAGQCPLEHPEYFTSSTDLESLDCESCLVRVDEQMLVDRFIPNVDLWSDSPCSRALLTGIPDPATACVITSTTTGTNGGKSALVGLSVLVGVVLL
ncbi:MAG: hypothetical protein KVP17_000161 [Porospora cf. gigantea B]|uniref:uncharacterized protein n=1 Tax=Porospora cf. gigantea B TaxID=2853592 RepID=UPI003571E93A|nr:MAG: hypothetical protein KVP17_000161 [Porospora cf. gigantea B]